jgi:hypothetical protein
MAQKSADWTHRKKYQDPQNIFARLAFCLGGWTLNIFDEQKGLQNYEIPGDDSDQGDISHLAEVAQIVQRDA